MAQVALVTDKGCLSGSGLAEGTTGQVLAQGVDGPEWVNAAVAAGDFDPCQMTAVQVTCLVQGFDFSQMNAAQVTALATALRGEVVQDAFGVELGYLLPL